MLAAGMRAVTVRMIVVVAVYIGVIAQIASQQRGDRRVGIAADTAVELDAGLRQRHLCAAADAAADQRIHCLLYTSDAADEL